MLWKNTFWCSNSCTRSDTKINISFVPCARALCALKFWKGERADATLSKLDILFQQACRNYALAIKTVFTQSEAHFGFSILNFSGAVPRTPWGAYSALRPSAVNLGNWRDLVVRFFHFLIIGVHFKMYWRIMWRTQNMDSILERII